MSVSVCLFKKAQSALIGQLSQAWAGTAHHASVSALSVFSQPQLNFWKLSTGSTSQNNFVAETNLYEILVESMRH